MKNYSHSEYLDQKRMKMDGLTRGWTQLQVPSLALDDLCFSSDGIVQSSEGKGMWHK
jgi:hypothetical protein